MQVLQVFVDFTNTCVLTTHMNSSQMNDDHVLLKSRSRAILKENFQSSGLMQFRKLHNECIDLGLKYIIKVRLAEPSLEL